YARVTGPLNAKGFLVTVDGVAADLLLQGYRLVVEEHPRYTFHLATRIPAQGRLSLRDTNYAASEGTSRLAVRGRDGILIQGYDGPAEVEQVPIRPLWELSDDEERRPREIAVYFRCARQPESASAAERAISPDGPADVVGRRDPPRPPGR